MRRAGLTFCACLILLGGVVFGQATRASGDGNGIFKATLLGIDEVPSVNSPGTATLRLRLHTSFIDFELRYANLTLAPVAAHIHFSERHVAGGVMVFFCGGGGKPACPSATSGTISGTITASDVIGPQAQGVSAGDLPAVERAIRSGAAYANMHTANFPSGEIRGQIGDHDD
jgi:hypothetical protein